MERLQALGASVEVPDLASGDFEHLTITGQLRIIEDVLGTEPAVLVGSSLGGYLAALFAAKHTSVQRLILLAPAFHFRRLWKERLGETGWQRWQQEGTLSVYHYALAGEAAIAFDLMRDAEAYPAQPDFKQPALIFHGTKDDVVPLASSVEFVQTHPNARLITLDSGHELTDALDTIWHESETFLYPSKAHFE